MGRNRFGRLTNTAGVVTDSYYYDAWGNALAGGSGSTVNPFRYTGQQLDADKKYYLRARFYIGPPKADGKNKDGKPLPASGAQKAVVPPPKEIKMFRKATADADPAAATPSVQTAKKGRGDGPKKPLLTIKPSKQTTIALASVMGGTPCGKRRPAYLANRTNRANRSPSRGKTGPSR